MPQKNQPHRRDFIKAASITALAASLPGPSILAMEPKPPKRSLPFRLDLNPGIIGIRAHQAELLQMALRHGFESITPFPAELAAFSDAELAAFQKERAAHDIAWGSTNIPVEFRQSEERFQKDLAALPQSCAAMQRADAHRMNTWIMPTHPTLRYTANLRQHAERLKQCARVLARYDIQLGLEYVGAKTLMVRDRFAFIRTFSELNDLIAAIDEPNVGYILDTFHWHCAEDSVEDIKSIAPERIVSVDLNDARSDLSRDEQIDGSRALPLATGVIDVKSFLQALVEIGYTGPVRAEPFNKELNAMQPEAALAATSKAMRAAFALVQ